jgi:hypothetical protein
VTSPQCTDKVFSATGLIEVLRYFFQPLGSVLILLILCMCLGSCMATAAPREFAPDGPVIQRAIAQKLQRHYQQLSQTISALPPVLEPKNIQVQSLDAFFLQSLPVYHLQGTYDLTLTFSSQRNETRRRNTFDLYLQRQPEGKTWRSLEQTSQGWRSQQLPD